MRCCTGCRRFAHGGLDGILITRHRHAAARSANDESLNAVVRYQGGGLPHESSSSKIRVAFLIRSLNRGGTEHQLAELVTRLDVDRFQILVLTFYGGGAVLDRLERTENVELVCLGKTG